MSGSRARALVNHNFLCPRAFPSNVCTSVIQARAGRHPAAIALQKRLKCSSSDTAKTVCQKETPPTTPTSVRFWSSRPLWNRAMVNTFRCLVGCTTGDFSAMWYLQAFHPDFGIGAIMVVSMVSGISTSLTLETILLRYGRDRLPWPAAAKTAAGMSMISMLTMELVQNTVDYHLTGGVVQFENPMFWAAAGGSMVAGFLAPLPYNYLRLRKYGRGCH